MTVRSIPPAMGQARGFSLLEMAVVLLIVGLLLGGILGGVDGARQRQRLAQTHAQLEEIRDALMAFAAIHGRLPCPAEPTTPDTGAGAGVERSPTPTGCAGGVAGVLPWATLGVGETDAWGRRFTYRVSALLAAAPAAITLSSTGDIVIRNGAAVPLATQVPAVVVSHGENALASYGPSGALAPPTAHPSELENADGDSEFVADTPAVGYDDVVQWVPGTVLVHRLLQAGRLP